MKKNNKNNIPNWVHFELCNWSRWCWLGISPGPNIPTHCASPEWQYERIREEGEIESVDSKPIPVNEVHAQIVQGVYEALPTMQAQVLRAEYPQRRSSVQKRLIVQMGKPAYESALNVALFRVMVAFEGRVE